MIKRFENWLINVIRSAVEPLIVELADSFEEFEVDCEDEVIRPNAVQPMVIGSSKARTQDDILAFMDICFPLATIQPRYEQAQTDFGARLGRS